MNPAVPGPEASLLLRVLLHDWLAGPGPQGTQAVREAAALSDSWRTAVAPQHVGGGQKQWLWMRKPRRKAQLCHLLAGQPRATGQTFLCLSFLICKERLFNFLSTHLALGAF